jgi:hypothetical protein
MYGEYEQVNGAVANALQAEVDALRKDAERLSWLLQNLRGADLYFLIGWIGDDMQAARSAIDAAMQGANQTAKRAA